MNYKMMGRLNALILTVVTIFMLPALFISLYYGEYRTVYSFAATMGIMLAVAGLLALFSRNAKKDFYAREGIVCVGMSWIIMSVFSCLPFVFSGAIPNYFDALFEIVSGYTTTGASIIRDLTPIPKGILYWRSFTHWLGGMGVLVFLLAIVPVGGKNEGFTMHLLRAESPGPDVGKIVPRMKQTAMVLYISYLALTVLCLLTLLFGNIFLEQDIPVFDAFCITFGTAGTGGFGVRNDSIASYTPYVQWVVTVFMLLFGVNFSCYYLLLLRKIKSVLRDEELRLYLCLVAVSTTLIVVNLLSSASVDLSTSDAIREAAFHVSSIITTTGFSVSDYNLWPTFSKTIIVILMCIGASAGSTGGGFKCARVLLLFKSLRRNLSQVLRPQKVKVIRVNGKVVAEKILSNTASYLFIYVFIIALSTLLISIDGFSIETNFTAVLACFNNIGPGLDAVGPVSNFADYSIFSKLILTINMLAGRLEIFPIILLFKAEAWKR